jgi:hypothetical protein
MGSPQHFKILRTIEAFEKLSSCLPQATKDHACGHYYIGV